jgi:hypothetical protein
VKRWSGNLPLPTRGFPLQRKVMFEMQEAGKVWAGESHVTVLGKTLLIEFVKENAVWSAC